MGGAGACAALALVLALTGWSANASAGPSRPDTARVTVRAISSDGRPVEGAAVRSGDARAATDAAGRARLLLGPGPRTITVVRLGFAPDTLHVVLRAAADTTLQAVLREQTIEVAPVVVSSTRIERRIEDEPERVEVLAGEDVEEKSETRPGDITTAVAEIAGVRVQTTSPATGAAGLRIQGLPAQYSAVLVDGLPLYGDHGTGLGLLQIPPLDLRQAEVIKGAATALYGPSALGGVLDLLTRRPGDTPERTAFVNRTSRDGTDGALWWSGRWSDRWGATFLGDGHLQKRTDVNHDGWADIPGYERLQLRPRLFWTGAHGRSAVATVGTMLENRTGGFGGNGLQRVDTRHGDAGLTARLPFGRTDVLSIRGAWNGTWQKRRQMDPVLGPVRVRERRQDGFGEATWLAGRGALVGLVGAALQVDSHRFTELPALDHRFVSPALLAQLTWTATPWLSTSAAGRCDFHNRYGTIASPRVSLMFHEAHALEVRLSAGTGFRASTPFTEDTETLPFTRLAAPAGLVAERGRNLSLDLTARRGALEMNGTAFVSVIDHPVMLAEPPDTLSNPAAAFATPVNAPGPARTHGYEVYAFYDREPITVTLNYAWLRATEVGPEGGARRGATLVPRQSAGLDVAWEEDETGFRAGIEVFYTGRQTLEHDPYRTGSAPYATIGILVSQRVGRALIYLNADDLADVRQTLYEPLLLPGPTPDGRLTVDAWAPLEGRVVNAGVRIGF